MVRTLSLLFLYFLPLGLLAQVETARLDLSKKDPLPVYVEYSSADGGIVTLGNMTKRSSRHLGLKKYDADFEQQWTKQVLTQNGRNHIDFLSVIGDNIYVFISEFFSRDRTIKTYYYQYDMDGNAIVEKKLVAELPNVKQQRVDLKYVRSMNKRRLLAFKILDNAGKPEKILYYLFDEDGQDFIPGEIELPYPDDRFKVKKILVSNSGQVYLLGKFYAVNRIKSPDDFSFQIYRYDPGNPNGDQLKVDLGDLYITDMTFKVDRSDNIFLAGFYSEKSTNAIIGTVFQRVNAALETEVSTTQKFGEEFLSKFLSDRQIDKGRELRSFYLDNIILRSDGGCLLIGEKYYTNYNSYLDIYGYWVDQRVYHYDDIIVNSVNPDGEIEWSGVVEKKQSDETQENLSYLEVINGSSLYLIYQYDPRRLPRTVYYNEISMDGEVSRRETLFGSNSFNDAFFPRFSEQISNSEALLVYYQERPRTYSIIKMDVSQAE